MLGIDCAESAVCTALKKLGFTFKKTIHAAEQDRPEVAERRACWREKQRQRDGCRLIFIDDETLPGAGVGEDEHGASAWMCSKGRATGGQDAARALEDDDADRGAGDRGGRCSMVVDGAVNAAVFSSPSSSGCSRRNCGRAMWW